MIISFSIFGIGSLIVGFLCFPLVRLFIKNNSQRLDTYSKIVHSSWKFFVRYLQLVGVLKLDIENFDSLKNIKNSIIVSTHPSYIDVLILLSLIPKTTCFVAPRLTENKFFKKIVESMFLISGKPLEDLENDTKKMSEEGFNILIFPSGKRHRKGEYPKIRKGASLVALNAQKDIVPIIMYTDFDFLQIGQPFYDAGIKPVTYCIRHLDAIKISEYLIIEDIVTQKKELSEKIKKTLYEL
jgi:1-acyl-sn-glycerol-3-phosphate acyltransferase